LLTRNAGERDQEHSLSHRDPCRPYNLCYHGIHYRCECELRARETALECQDLTSSLKASIVSQTGGTCVCDSKTDPTCIKDADYAQCVLGNILLRSPHALPDQYRHSKRLDHSHCSNLRTCFLHVWLAHQPTGCISVREQSYS
jgi:hypothetical protein